MYFRAVSGPRFTGRFSSNAGGIAIVCIVFRFWISWAVPEIFAIKSEVIKNFAGFCPRIFFGSASPNFWTGIIKLSQIPTMWQSFRAIGRGTSEKAWREKEDTSRVKHKPVRNGGSGRPNKYILYLLWLYDACRGRGRLAYSVQEGLSTSSLISAFSNVGMKKCWRCFV